MGLYLPNMEMPREGQMLVIFPDGTSYVSFNGMRECLAQTEAVPVPKHGRLIDADAPCDDLITMTVHIEAAGSLLRMVRAAPTIIEMEGEESRE